MTRDRDFSEYEDAVQDGYIYDDAFEDEEDESDELEYDEEEIEELTGNYTYSDPSDFEQD